MASVQLEKDFMRDRKVVFLVSNRRIKCLCSKALLSVLTSGVILLSTGCLAPDQGVNRNTIVIVPVNTDVPSGGDLIQIDSYESADEYIEILIKEISQN